LDGRPAPDLHEGLAALQQLRDTRPCPTDKRPQFRIADASTRGPHHLRRRSVAFEQVDPIFVFAEDDLNSRRLRGPKDHRIVGREELEVGDVDRLRLMFAHPPTGEGRRPLRIDPDDPELLS